MDWTSLKTDDNLSQEERMALHELKEAPKLIIKKMTKGNVVLFSEEHYEKPTK